MVALLAFGLSAASAEARAINAQTFRELEKISDLIVVAKPVSTQDTDERTDLQGMTPAIPVIGLSTEFDVSLVVKGEASLKKVVVHHYRLVDPDKLMINGPGLAAFDLKETNRYLLFLHREADGRYAPYEQIDPMVSSFLKLSGSEWDAMSADNFKRWLNARKWRAEQVPFGKLLSSDLWPAEWNENSIFEAVVNGEVEKVRELVAANPSLVSMKANYGQQTPLHAAAEMGHGAVAEVLLNHNADVEAKAYFNWTPLLNAVFGGHTEMVELLLKHNADVNFQDNAGRGALHVAAENGFTATAELLLTNKAEVDLKNHDGMTPLHIAASLGHRDFAELMLKHGADINAKDKSGRTPLTFAVMRNNEEMARLLKEYGGTK